MCLCVCIYVTVGIIDYIAALVEVWAECLKCVAAVKMFVFWCYWDKIQKLQ